MADPAPPRRPWALDATERRAFLLIALASAVVAAAVPTAGWFAYDSGGYFIMLRDVTTVREWFTALADPIRGYAPLLVFNTLREFSEATGLSQWLVVGAFNVVLFGWLSAVLLPRLGELMWPEVRLGLWRRLVLGAAMLVFWGGYVSYPLSDIPALCLAIAAILLAARSDRPIGAIGAGLAAGMALNMRPAYLALPLALLVIAWARGRWHLPASTMRRTPRALAILGGLLLVCLPQSVLASWRWNSPSPLPGAPSGLTSLQLTAGFRLQLYGTYVGNEGPGPVMNYRDRAGESLVLPEFRDESGAIPGYVGWLRVALHNPVGVSTNIGRHVVNGFDQRYATPYPTRLDTGQRRPFRVAGFAIIGFAITRLLWPRARRTLGRAAWLPGIVLATGSLSALPSAIEPRFLLPWFVLALLLAVAPGWSRMFEGVPARRRAVELLIVAICWSLSAWEVARVTSAASDALEMGFRGVTALPW